MGFKRFGRIALYEKARKVISKRGRGHLSKLLVFSGLKPTANSARASGRRQGTVVFSADFEMAWAFRYSRSLADRAEAMGLMERKQVPQLLEIFDCHEVPITWATVGHLFLSDCRRDPSGRPHPEMPRPGHFENRNWRFTAGDWYDHDPCSSDHDYPAWYAPDLIDRILKARAKHEIACHTFSHIDFSDAVCSQTLAAAELDACMNLARIRNIRLKSMVFPGGTYGNFERLKERGILCYRKPAAFHLDEPEIDAFGLVSIPSSLGLDRDPYGWSREYHLDMLRKFLEKTLKTGLVCHFWFHPSMDEWYLDKVLPDLIAMVAELRNQGALRVRTMAQLAEETLGKNSVAGEKR